MANADSILNEEHLNWIRGPGQAALLADRPGIRYAEFVVVSP